METTVKKPRKRKVPTESKVSEPEPVGKGKQPVKLSRKQKAPPTGKEIVFMKPPVAEKKTRSRKAKKGETTSETETTSPKSPRKRKLTAAAQEKTAAVVAVPESAEKATKLPRKRKKANSPAAQTVTSPVEKPKPAKKKKATQASWDKWIKATVLAVSPDVWNIHASELSHNSLFLNDLRKLPKRVLLDTPALDYLFRCPDRLSHNARLVLNEEGVECLVSFESLREWADKMRTGHYLIGKENGFFDKILDRFDLESVVMTTDVYQKYISMKTTTFVDISWERKPEDTINARLDANERPTRIIAAQALVLGIPILSPDLRYEAYKRDGLKMVW